MYCIRLLAVALLAFRAKSADVCGARRCEHGCAWVVAVLRTCRSLCWWAIRSLRRVKSSCSSRFADFCRVSLFCSSAKLDCQVTAHRCASAMRVRAASPPHIMPSAQSRCEGMPGQYSVPHALVRSSASACFSWPCAFWRSKELMCRICTLCG